MPSAIPKSLITPPKFTLPKVNLPSVLPTDVAALTALFHAQQAAHQAAVESLHKQFADHLNHLVEQFILARHRQFGVSSEHVSGQGRLFDEVEILAADTSEAQDAAPIPPEVPAASSPAKPEAKARGKRAPLPPELPRVDIVHDVPV